MNATALLKLILRSISRSRKNFLMSGLGIVVGISTFVFFIGLAEGVREVVLGKVYLVDQIEVVPRRFDTGFTQISGSRPLDQAMVDELSSIPGVSAVYPKMKLTFPTRGYGGKAIFGRDVWAEIIADGIEPRLVASELNAPDGFRDWEAPISCSPDKACPDGRRCEAGQCSKIKCRYAEQTRLSACPGESYCAKDTSACELPIPFVVSNHLLELYNGSLATALSGGAGPAMPRVSKNTVLGFQINVTLGKSFLGRAAKAAPITRRIKLVGFSDRAITVGVTFPLAYVKRFNSHFSGQKAGATYHSVIISVADQRDVGRVVEAINSAGFDLAQSTKNAEQAANIIRTVESVFALISMVIVGIAAVNISQLFFMLVSQRRREIGLYRALGASQSDIRIMFLGEATIIGLVGGIVGSGAGYLISRGVDWLSTKLPEFPYKPDTFFAFPSWLWVAAVVISIVFCLAGAFFPATAAARQEPAAALTE